MPNAWAAWGWLPGLFGKLWYGPSKSSFAFRFRKSFTAAADVLGLAAGVAPVVPKAGALGRAMVKEDAEAVPNPVAVAGFVPVSKGEGAGFPKLDEGFGPNPVAEADPNPLAVVGVLPKGEGVGFPKLDEGFGPNPVAKADPATHSPMYIYIYI